MNLSTVKQRKYMLVIDSGGMVDSLIREPLTQALKEYNVSFVIIHAKDGAEAAIKAENQRFDSIIIDTEVPRLMDGGFVYNLRVNKNTRDCEVYAISAMEPDQLPEALKTAKLFKKPINPEDLVNSIKESIKRELEGNQKFQQATSNDTRYAVDVRVINAVVKATMHVLEQFGVSGIKMGKPSPKAIDHALRGSISSVIEIKSPSFRGSLSISFETQTFLDVVSTMFGETQSEINSENQDAVGEINNIIYGNAKSDLTALNVAMSIPKVLMGEGQVLSCPAGSAAIEVPFESAAGKFYLQVVATPLELN